MTPYGFSLTPWQPTLDKKRVHQTLPFVVGSESLFFIAGSIAAVCKKRDILWKMYQLDKNALSICAKENIEKYVFGCFLLRCGIRSYEWSVQ